MPSSAKISSEKDLIPSNKRVETQRPKAKQKFFATSKKPGVQTKANFAKPTAAETTEIKRCALLNSWLQI
jgi:hypothetical protein